MSNAHPHWRRSAIVAGIGLLIATVSIVWVGLVVRTVGPKTLSLAYRIDAKKTLAFTRSPDRKIFENRIRMLTTLLQPDTDPPDTKTLPSGLSYEYALVDTGSGNTAWIMGVRQKNQMDEWITEPESDLTLLPTQNIKESLGALPFFRSNEGTASVTITYLPLRENDAVPVGPSADIFRAMRSPYDALIVAEQKDGETKMIVRKREPTAFTTNAVLKEMTLQEGSSQMTIALPRPAAMLASLQSLLEEQAPRTAEGIIGIAKAVLDRMTHRSDLQNAIRGLLQEHLLLSVGEDGQGNTQFVLSVEAAFKETVDLWLQAIDSAHTPAIIRRQKFLHENNRTDVAAAPEKASRTLDHWMMREIGSGSTLSLAIATRETSIIMAQDVTRLERAIQEREKASTDTPAYERGIMAGTVMLPWLTARLQEFDDTAWLAALVQSMAGSEPRTIRWKAIDSREALIVEFSEGQRGQ